MNDPTKTKESAISAQLEMKEWWLPTKPEALLPHGCRRYSRKLRAVVCGPKGHP